LGEEIASKASKKARSEEVYTTAKNKKKEKASGLYTTTSNVIEKKIQLYKRNIFS